MTFPAKYSDEQLSQLLKGGNEQALKLILDRYWEPLFKMAIHILDDRFICEDVIQNIFIKIWQNRDSLDFTYSLKAYLFASTRYEIYRQIKLLTKIDEKTAQLMESRIESYNPHNELEYRQLLENVERIVNALPERCRDIYIMSREEELSHKEIASYLKISVKTVESQITIALRRIRNSLQ